MKIKNINLNACILKFLKRLIINKLIVVTSQPSLYLRLHYPCCPPGCQDKKLLHWFDGMLEDNEGYFKANGEPLFSSHMLDLGEKFGEENIATYAQYFKRMAAVKLWLEMEIGITGGEEDGVDNSRVKAESLFTKLDRWISFS